MHLMKIIRCFVDMEFFTCQHFKASTLFVFHFINGGTRKRSLSFLYVDVLFYL